MSRFLIKLANEEKSWYLEWSTVVDAPVTRFDSLEELKEYYQAEYGRSAMYELDKRLARVEEKGTSSFIHESADDLISYNRAGQNGTCLSKEQIIKYYCTEELTELPLGTRHD